MTDQGLDADWIIRELDLRPHPEGGHFRETWRAPAAPGERAAGTAIYFLLKSGEISKWHRVDADEIWHWYAGAPLALHIFADAGHITSHALGPGLVDGQRPQVLVPAGAWQSAESTGAWTLVGCTVSPAFEFEGFEMAPDGWRPGP